MAFNYYAQYAVFLILKYLFSGRFPEKIAKTVLKRGPSPFRIFDGGAAFYCGKIRAELEKKGEILSSMDLLVASIAISNDLILVTGNTRHFKRIKMLQIEDWMN